MVVAFAASTYMKLGSGELVSMNDNVKTGH